MRCEFSGARNLPIAFLWIPNWAMRSARMAGPKLTKTMSIVASANERRMFYTVLWENCTLFLSSSHAVTLSYWHSMSMGVYLCASSSGMHQMSHGVSTSSSPPRRAQVSEANLDTEHEEGKHVTAKCKKHTSKNKPAKQPKPERDLEQAVEHRNRSTVVAGGDDAVG